MTPAAERRLLQVATALACLVPLGAGGLGVVQSAAMLRGIDGPVMPDLDSHFRFLSGVFLGLGICFATCVPRIERHGPRFRLLGACVLTGGLARLASAVAVGVPTIGHRFGLTMELGVMPLLLLWQARVARRSAG